MGVEQAARLIGWPATRGSILCGGGGASYGPVGPKPTNVGHSAPMPQPSCTTKGTVTAPGAVRRIANVYDTGCVGSWTFNGGVVLAGSTTPGPAATTPPLPLVCDEAGKFSRLR